MDKKKQVKVKKWVKKNQKLGEKITNNKDDLTDILDKVNDIKVDDKGPIDGFMDSIKELYNLVTDWKDKKYTDVSKTTIASVVVCFVYFVSPVDIIPDFIPVAGLLDDALVLKITLGQIGSDLDSYRNWKSNQQQNLITKKNDELVENVESSNEMGYRDIDKVNKEKLNPFEEIKKFKELYDMGILSEDEFAIKKKEILNI